MRSVIRWALVLVGTLVVTRRAAAVDYIEGFDNVTGSPPAPPGWVVQNNSTQPPAQVTNWFQGNPAVFPSYQGAPNSYLAARFDNTGSTVPSAIISNWAITPQLDLRRRQGSILHSHFADSHVSRSPATSL